MKRMLKHLRNMLLVFVFCFTAIMIISMLYGVHYDDNRKIWLLLLDCAIFGILSPLTYSEKLLTTKPRYIIAQILYVVMLNVVYILTLQLGQFVFGVWGYILSSIATVAVFILIRFIMFQLDKAEADRINEHIRKKKRKDELPLDTDEEE